jgi:hypothetical protein
LTVPESYDEAKATAELEEFLVCGEDGLWRFRDPHPDFEYVVNLWARLAQGTFQAVDLDWSALEPRARVLVAQCAAPWPWRPDLERPEQEQVRLPDEPTMDDVIGLVRGLSTGLIAPDFVDWDCMSQNTRNNVWMLSRYEIRRLRGLDQVRRRGDPQKRAMRLLRSLLTPTQLWWLRQRRHFLITGATTGHVYRLNPYFGHTSRVTKHGSRWFVHTRFCLHDPEVLLPPADVMVGHLLLLRADEPRFLELANATDARGMAGLWNGEWLRRVRRRRIEREEAA